MVFMFEMKDRDGLARICNLELNGKALETPALLPVVNPKSYTIAPRRLKEEFKFNALITNSYIISKDQELRRRALEEGVHRLLDYNGIIMTDSGTFQQHVYGELGLDSSEVVSFQRDIRSDIGTILDVFSEPDFSKEKAEDAVRVTVDRAKAAVSIRGEMWLAGPIQGSLHEELRTKCAMEMSALDIQLHPIGGVVPLMENYKFVDLAGVIIASKKGLNPSRPVHLFGAGHPMIFPLAVLLGCDMFDSASYAKYARDGRMMFADGTMALDGMTEFWCQCPVCSTHTPEELKSMEEEERTTLLAEHNLHECQSQIRRVKSAIRDGTIWELAEKSCRSHPRLLDALRTLHRHNDFLERFEPLSRVGALMFTGSESYHRPAIWRYQKRFFERYSHPSCEVMIGLPESRRPYSRTYSDLIRKTDAHLVVLSSIGPVPMELDEIYPVSQIFLPERDDESYSSERQRIMERFSHDQRYGLAVIWEGEETLEFLSKMRTRVDRPFDIDRARVVAVLMMQFGPKAVKAVENQRLDYVKSKTVGRIRNVLVNGVHSFSIRAADGYFSLTDEGARLLHSVLPQPSYRVTVHTDAVPFIKKGSNVFSKFVLATDDELRPGDSTLIVDKDDNLVGHGRCLMNGEEMLAFKRGIAVKTRSGFPDDSE